MQLSYSVLFSKSTDFTNNLQFFKYKWNRSKSSILVLETFPFADVLEQTVTIRYYLSDMLQSRLPLTILTGTEILFFDNTSRSPVMSEKSLMVDLRAATRRIRRRLILTLT